VKIKTSKNLCIFFAFTNFLFYFLNNSLTNGIISVMMLMCVVLFTMYDEEYK
jgi:VanZ family protein